MHLAHDWLATVQEAHEAAHVSGPHSARPQARPSVSAILARRAIPEARGGESDERPRVSPPLLTRARGGAATRQAIGLRRAATIALSAPRGAAQPHSQQEDPQWTK